MLHFTEMEAAGHCPKTHFLNAMEDLKQHITNNNAEEQDHNNHFIFIPWSAGDAGFDFKVVSSLD